ncbi:MAG: putative nucleic acid-binding protein [Cyclobacteriaceae bacterium]
MILVDTSVWIDYFNGQENKATDYLDDCLIEGTVAIGDLIYLEILQGFRADRDYRTAKTKLEELTIYEMFGLDAVEQCAKYYRMLRKKGITVRKTADVIIASFCIRNKMPLLFLDRDFVPFVKHLGLTPALRET